MSVLVNGMEMPKSCMTCLFQNPYMGGWCSLLNDNSNAYSRRRDCPLVPVPPHGRLIDADEITEHKYATIPPHRKEYADGKPKSDEEIIAFKFGWNYAIDAIVENAPAIIPAEEGET